MEDTGKAIIGNRVLLHRIADTLNHLDLKTVIVHDGIERVLL